jgi:hypothetical protein
MCKKNVLIGVLPAMLLLGGTVVQADTSLNPGGNIMAVADWDNGRPSSSNPGTVTVYGVF